MKRNPLIYTCNNSYSIQRHFYRPQTKFAKVMFLHRSVSHSVHKGGGVLHPERSASRGVGNPPPIRYYRIRSTRERYSFLFNICVLRIIKLKVSEMPSNFLSFIPFSLLARIATCSAFYEDTLHYIPLSLKKVD